MPPRPKSKFSIETLSNPGPQGLYEGNYVCSINVNKKRNVNNEPNLRTLLWDEVIIFVSTVINLVKILLQKSHESIGVLLRWLNDENDQIFEMDIAEEEEYPGLTDDSDEEWEKDTDERTINIVDARPNLGVVVNNRFKDEVLIDSGSCTNIISKSKLEVIERLTGNQIPRLKEEAPPLYDMNNRRVDGDGIVMLNLKFTANGFEQKKVPFVVSNLEDRLLIGSNTIKARKLSVGSNGKEFIIQKLTWKMDARQNMLAKSPEIKAEKCFMKNSNL